MKLTHLPKKQGLYDPKYEHDSCGVGFLCNIKGKKTHTIIPRSLKILNKLSHRGAVGADPKTGDGAGILIQIPHQFFQKAAEKVKINLPEPGEYGTGLIFFPTNKKDFIFCKNVFEKIIQQEGQMLLGWRDVPVNNSVIGETAKETEPIIQQIFIKRNPGVKDQITFERKLYVIRKQIENIIRDSDITQKTFFYITNISTKTFSYKGLLMPEQVGEFFIDLQDPDIKSSLSIVHSRYSTNTFPTWDLAQPFRFLAHNGEINTLQGNINWMKARESLLESELFKEDLKKIKPIITPDLSDSAAIDNVFELLTLAGRPLPQVMMMLIPVAWENNSLMDEHVKDFYKFHACLMEPWDGPAAIAFTDGTKIGAVLDRNGLRPARYIVTKQDTVVMASEVGVLDIKPEDISYSGRIEPGKMFFIDTEKGEIILDREIKETFSKQSPYSAWIKQNLINLRDIKLPKNSPREDMKPLTDLTFLKVFGYTREDLHLLITPMAETGKEPTGSMGNDTPLAVLSDKTQLLYNYFKQLFAQVTNPAIDPIREEIIMSMESYIGPRQNILKEIPEHCRKIRVEEPILMNDELRKIRTIKQGGFRAKTISTLFPISDKSSFGKSLDKIRDEAEEAIKNGYTFIILSDKGTNAEYAALPALLASGAVHQHLVRKAMRARISIIVESGEPREVFHFALLFGYGADCINPYLAYQAVNYLVAENQINLSVEKALKNYRNALNKGIFKILSKMGISTLRSYRGAQIFEALGLHDDVISKCFTGTPSRIGGATLKIIAEETIQRHKSAFVENKKIDYPNLSSGGVYQWKRDGAFHLWNPESISALQDSVRKGDYSRYKEFASLINDQSKNPTTLRGLLKFKKRKAISLDKVESVENILKRFVTGAMSFGSISNGAHETLAIAMNRIGGKSNTGEGGEDPLRFVPLPNGDTKRSAIKQVASGRFGVTTNYLVNADEIQIKIAQGAKPGEGGQLPGHKVSASIAKIRYTTPGVTLISPPPHHDIYSIEDLAQLIYDLKNTNPSARISVKLVSEVGVGTIAAGVAKGHADMILISGGDGGTGASPKSSIMHAGLPWELGLAETHQTLVLNGLRSRVRLQTDGQMRTGRDVAIAAILGAEEYGFCTIALIVMGCVMLRHCHLNNCSLGIATQDAILQRRFQGRPEYVINYMNFVAQELREIMAQIGVSTINELIGNTDLIEVNSKIIPWKAKDIDYSKILYKPKVHPSVGTYCQTSQNHNIDKVLDRKLIELAEAALKKTEPVQIDLDINNVNRSTGAMLSGLICKNYGEEGLPEDTIYCRFKGIAGQSFGAFLAKGVTLELEGIANDYVGKGISGGKIIIYPDKKAGYRADENILIGNTTFYGAVRGEAYIRGMAGERFCIRNSGLYAVIEGVGDHGCEYMTGGRIIILGDIGRNFAAGMSGGIAYIFDKNNIVRERCNLSMVALEKITIEDEKTIHYLLRNHLKYTESSKAKKILDNFHQEKRCFKKIMPIEYKKILETKVLDANLDLTEISDG